MDFHTLKGITDEQFEEVLTEATLDFNKKQEQLAQEKAEQIRLEILEQKRKKTEQDESEAKKKVFEKEQADFLETQRVAKAEQEKRDKAILEAQQKIDADKKAIQDEKDRLQKEVETQAKIESAKKEAYENALIEADKKSKKEAQDKIDAAIKEKEDEEERISLLSDKAKFTLLSQHIEKFMAEKLAFEFKSKTSIGKINKIHSLFEEAKDLCA
jgi:hypothetical protein